LTNFILFF